MKSVREAIGRDPSADNNPLDRASFYVEELKYGPGAGRLERAEGEEAISQLEALLRDAGVTSMTGEQLFEATLYYAASLSRALDVPFQIGLSMFFDGLMHGIAFGAGLEGEHRNPRGR